jgi:hypothetical protein
MEEESAVEPLLVSLLVFWLLLVWVLEFINMFAIKPDSLPSFFETIPITDSKMTKMSFKANCPLFYRNYVLRDFFERWSHVRIGSFNWLLVPFLLFV